MDSLVGSAPPAERFTPRQITVIRPGALGDTLLTLPALAALRHRWPAAHLTFIARADTLPLALANGLADRAWPWELPDWGVLFAQQPAHLTPRARAELVGAASVILWATDPAGDVARTLRALGVGQALVAPALPPDPAPGADDIHAAMWLIETLRPLGVAPLARPALDDLVPALHAPDADFAQADARWGAWGQPQQVVSLHPGAGSPVKRWPAERFAEVARLAREAGYTPLLLAGEADTLALAETRAALARLGVAAHEARDVPVATLAALLARCVGYVGCDSGVSHLAGLVGAPTVAIFGPTDPARWSPLGPHVRALRSTDAQLDHVSADAVWAALRALLAATSQETPL